jgi:hypothetical protein
MKYPADGVAAKGHSVILPSPPVVVHQSRAAGGVSEQSVQQTIGTILPEQVYVALPNICFFGCTKAVPALKG